MRAMTRASSGTLGKPYRWPDPSVVADVEAKDEGVPHRQAIEEQHEAVQELPAANTDPSADIEGRCEQEQRVEGEDPGVEAHAAAGQPVAATAPGIRTLCEVLPMASKTVAAT